MSLCQEDLSSRLSTTQKTWILLTAIFIDIQESKPVIEELVELLIIDSDIGIRFVKVEGFVDDLGFILVDRAS